MNQQVSVENSKIPKFQRLFPVWPKTRFARLTSLDASSAQGQLPKTQFLLAASAQPCWNFGILESEYYYYKYLYIYIYLYNYFNPYFSSQKYYSIKFQPSSNLAGIGLEFWN